MVQELSYGTISPVIESWEKLRRVKNYEEVAGSVLFQYLFEKSPQAKVLFGFPIDIDPHCKDLLSSKRYVMHASYLIQMLDSALDMLGPDIELLTEILEELGRKHVRFGVQPEMYAIMGQALIHALTTTLGDHVMDDSCKVAWMETYNAMAQDMIRVQAKAKRGEKQ